MRNLSNPSIRLLFALGCGGLWGCGGVGDPATASGGDEALLASHADDDDDEPEARCDHCPNLTWTVEPSGAVGDVDLRSIWGSGRHDLYIGGRDIGGEDLDILRGTGHDDWHRIAVPALSDIVWGADAHDVFLPDFTTYRSTDHGASWSSYATFPGPHLWATSDTHFWAGGEGGVWHSTDRGLTWTERVVLPGWTFEGVWARHQLVVAVAHTDDTLPGMPQSRILVSSDGGASFAGTDFANTRVSGVWGANGRNLYVVGATGSAAPFAVRSRDRGATWTALSTGATLPLSAVWGADAHDVYLVGAHAAVHSCDRGDSWSLLTLPRSVFFYALWGSGAHDVYIVGEFSTILHGQ